jgi:hypothetical protein
MSIFDSVKFFCTSTLADQRKADLTLLLKHNGAQPVPLREATHIITRSLDYDGQDNAIEGSATVTVNLSCVASHARVLIIKRLGLLGRPFLNPRKASVVSEHVSFRVPRLITILESTITPRIQQCYSREL